MFQVEKLVLFNNSEALILKALSLKRAKLSESSTFNPQSTGERIWSFYRVAEKTKDFDHFG